MPNNLALALIINLALLLVLSWSFFLVVMAKQAKQKKKKTTQGAKNSESSKKEDANSSLGLDQFDELEPFDETLELSEDDFLSAIEQQKQVQLDRLNSVDAQLAALHSSDTEQHPLQAEVNLLQRQLQQSLQTINRQQKQAMQRRNAVADQDAAGNEEKIQGLQSKLATARSENLHLREEVEKIQKQNDSLLKYRSEHREMSQKMNDYIEQNRKNSKLIGRLKTKLDEAQQAADEAQSALENSHDNGGNDEALQEALQRAEKERLCIEEQYMELLAQIEDAEKISEELERSQKECAQLEQAYLDLVAEVETETPAFAVESESAAVEASTSELSDFALDDDMSEFAVEEAESDDPDFGDDDFGKPSEVFASSDAAKAANMAEEQRDEIEDINEKWLAQNGEKVS